MGRISFDSKAFEVEDFILYHKYVASDEKYGKEIKDFLVRAEEIVDKIPKSDPVPEDLITQLIKLAGDEYDG